MPRKRAPFTPASRQGASLPAAGDGGTARTCVRHPRSLRPRSAERAAGSAGRLRKFRRRRARRPRPRSGRRRASRSGRGSGPCTGPSARPGPAAELRALVVAHGLLDFGTGVHHERAVLDHRLADRPALQQQELRDRPPAASSATSAVGSQHEARRARRRGAGRRSRSVGPRRSRASGHAGAGTRQRAARARRHADRPDRHVGVGLRAAHELGGGAGGRARRRAARRSR